MTKKPPTLLRRILSARIPYLKLFSLRSRNMQNSQIPENWNRNDSRPGGINQPRSFLEALSTVDSREDRSMEIEETELSKPTTWSKHVRKRTVNANKIQIPYSLSMSLIFSLRGLQLWYI